MCSLWLRGIAAVKQDLEKGGDLTCVPVLVVQHPAPSSPSKFLSHGVALGLHTVLQHYSCGSYLERHWWLLVFFTPLVMALKILFSFCHPEDLDWNLNLQGSQQCSKNPIISLNTFLLKIPMMLSAPPLNEP